MTIYTPYVTHQSPFGSWGGGGGEGTSHIKTLMIYRKAIGPNCAPAVILFDSADELSICQEFFDRSKILF